MAEIIELTPTARLLVEHDADAEPPRGGDWGALCGFVKLPGHGDSRRIDVPAVHEAPVDLVRMWQAIVTRNPWTPFTDILYRRQEQAFEQVERWARIFTGLKVVFDHTHGGWWFRHYDEGEDVGTLEEQAEGILADRTLYEQWAEGRVYEVTLQREQVWVAVDPTREPETPPATRTTWEVVTFASIAGCYLDDEYTAQHVALEHFPLTDDEAAAARGSMPAGALADDAEVPA